jgi:hypothetical protein
MSACAVAVLITLRFRRETPPPPAVDSQHEGSRAVAELVSAARALMYEEDLAGARRGVPRVVIGGSCLEHCRLNVLTGAHRCMCDTALGRRVLVCPSN